MIDWLQFFRDWITPVVAVLGFGLGVWTALAKWREDRKKAFEARPWAHVNFTGQAQVESASHEIRVLAIEFHNPMRTQWTATRVQVLEPRTACVRRKGKGGPWVRAIDLHWTVTSAADVGDGRSRGELEMRFERQPATEEVGPPRELAVRITAHEVSAKRRRHTFEARKLRHF